MADILKWLFGERGRKALDQASTDSAALLQPYLGLIRATERPMIGATVEQHAPSTPTGSQLGGFPWWPVGRPWPVDRSGAPLFLLAQINFSEAPPVDPLPRSGLLQIFIGSDDLYGCDFDAPASGSFTCVLHDETAGPRVEDFSFLTFDQKSQCSPLEEPLRARALKLFPDRMPVDAGDYRMETLLPELAAAERLIEAYHELARPPAIRLGGYPSFTQDDPRRYGSETPLGDFTLLTVDTTDGIMWGDCGVAQFFMHEDDLRRRDVSKVAYNWDCC